MASLWCWWDLLVAAKVPPTVNCWAGGANWGNICVGDRLVNELPQGTRHRYGVSELRLYPHMTVYDNLALDCGEQESRGGQGRWELYRCGLKIC